MTSYLIAVAWVCPMWSPDAVLMLRLPLCFALITVSRTLASLWKKELKANNCALIQPYTEIKQSSFFMQWYCLHSEDICLLCKSRASVAQEGEGYYHMCVLRVCTTGWVSWSHPLLSLETKASNKVRSGETAVSYCLAPSGGQGNRLTKMTGCYTASRL